ncbi:mRNA decay activator protein ZFP36 [Varanus komodoensis]|uniref:mRNA decay activator protein ZFP36 n=1 Tax=Varanus komodoensis TaxID=61221 RepID=A0A8D2J8A2_VARKO|nr:mRNA decay activator protein ZFP36-like [Varanus komodoensis]KAF7242241.1 mRNA decay activator protein ZFP36 [Varanus komodoensis]
MSSMVDLKALYENLLKEEQDTSGPLLSRCHSACSADAPYGGSLSPVWPCRSHWSPGGEQLQPLGEPGRRPTLRPDRSISLIEGRALPAPPPGFPPLRHAAQAPAPSSRYKTELCHSFSESGKCRYGAKCQFAHGASELRTVSRHPKYKTELCQKFYRNGECPYGSRCHFIHYPGEAASAAPQALRQSVSFSGVPAHLQSPTLPGMPDPASFARAPSVSPPPASADLLSPPFGLLNSASSSFLSTLGDSPSASRGCCLCQCGRSAGPAGSFQTMRDAFSAAPGTPTSTAPNLPRTPSSNSLSDPESYSSSGSLSRSDSPVFDLQLGLVGASHRLPIFNRLSVSE